MADEWTRISHEAWLAEGQARFGLDPTSWRFLCPSCGQVQTRTDFLKLGMSLRLVDTVIGFSCIGRWNVRNRSFVVNYCEQSEGYGCTYAGGGNINISPYTVLLPDGSERPTFGYAP